MLLAIILLSLGSETKEAQMCIRDSSTTTQCEPWLPTPISPKVSCPLPPQCNTSNLFFWDLLAYHQTIFLNKKEKFSNDFRIQNLVYNLTYSSYKNSFIKCLFEPNQQNFVLFILNLNIIGDIRSMSLLNPHWLSLFLNHTEGLQRVRTHTDECKYKVMWFLHLTTSTEWINVKMKHMFWNM